MSRSDKKWLIAAACLVVTGLLVLAAVMTSSHWDFERLNPEPYETTTYEFAKAFSKMELNADTADILLAASDDDMCRVVCYEEEKRKHSVCVQDSTLIIRDAEADAWYEQTGFHSDSPKITVYLPETEYTSIEIRATTGDIVISKEIRAERADLSLTTGDIRLHHMSVGTLNLSASTGEIIISNVTCTEDVNISTSTGAVVLTDLTCRELVSSGRTGDIGLKNVMATEKISIETSTGSVVFDRSDSAEIFVKTSTGDVIGSLLTEKVFSADTSTGDLSLPNTASGGRCEIITSTGDVQITISDGTDA